jgi:hypothetical protein
LHSFFTDNSSDKKQQKTKILAQVKQVKKKSKDNFPPKKIKGKVGNITNNTYFLQKKVIETDILEFSNGISIC